MKQFINTLIEFFTIRNHKADINYENRRILPQNERESIFKEIEVLSLVVEANSDFISGDWEAKDKANEKIKSLIKLL